MANEISGADIHQECMWFTKMDEWHDNIASVRNQILANAAKSTLEDANLYIHSFQTTTATTPNSTTTSTQNKKKKIQEKIELLLKHIIGNLRVFLSHSKNPQIF